jgi:6-pyruvoyl-tetrahydropterin synthase
MDWDVEVQVVMDESGEDNMPLDLKSVSTLIDHVDHALLLKHDDELVELCHEDDIVEEPGHVDPLLYHGNIEPLGEVFLFEGDPTCEVLSQWMADRITSLDPVATAAVKVNETDKYGISTSSR